MAEDPDLSQTEGALGVPAPAPPAEPDAGGFNYLLLGLLLLVAGLVAVQNLWLRRRAQREKPSSEDA